MRLKFNFSGTGWQTIGRGSVPRLASCRHRGACYRPSEFITTGNFPFNVALVSNVSNIQRKSSNVLCTHRIPQICSPLAGEGKSESVAVFARFQQRKLRRPVPSPSTSRFTVYCTTREYLLRSSSEQRRKQARNKERALHQFAFAETVQSLGSRLEHWDVAKRQASPTR